MTEDQPQAEDKCQVLLGELRELIPPLKRAEARQAKKHTDERVQNIRDYKERINTLFWEYLFHRLRTAGAESEADFLAFNDDDLDRFNFGWVDELTFPRTDLTNLVEENNDLPDILHLTQWLQREDSRNMEVGARSGITSRINKMTSRVDRIHKEILDAQKSRGEMIRTHFGSRAAVLQQTASELEECEVIIGYHADRRKSRSIGKQEVKELMERQRRRDTLHPEWERALERLNSATSEMLAFAHRDAIQKRLLSLRMKQEIEHQDEDRIKADEKVVELLASRRVYLEERLREIRSDIVLCSRWGRTESYCTLLEHRKIHTKRDVMEAVETIADYDPGIFDNRKVKREGRPTILLTPGTGNGSYDFRTNTLIIPVSSPAALLESVAFALALYRRDVDQEFNESTLWHSFYDDALWRKIKNRSRPRRFKDQMFEFVNTYVRWITREAKGLRVLEREIRGWYEQYIAPNARAMIVPRNLRGVRGSEADRALEDLAGKEPSADTFYDSAVLKFVKEDYDESIRLLNKAFDQDPERQDIWWGLGIIYYVIDDVTIEEEAITRLRGLGRRKRMEIASGHFSKFLQGSKQSWWTVKAQDHLRKAQEAVRR